MKDIVEAHKLWKDLCANTNALERTLLKMMAHPEATPELLGSVRETYITILQSMQNTLNTLQNRYPRRGTTFSPAWQFTSLSGRVMNAQPKEKT